MKQGVNNFVKQHKWTLLAIFVLIIYLSPNIFFPEKARFVIHDNLDSNVVWYKNLAESGKMFAANNEIIPNSLGGIPRGCYPSQFNFNHSLYLVFAPLLAYNINIIFTHVIAFFSMYVFLRRYVLRSSPEWHITSVALLFALLPFWPAGGTTIATQPLLLYAFLNILYKKYTIKDWLIVFLVPFFTVLIHSNFFFLVMIFFYSLWFFYTSKKINFYFLLALVLYSIVTIFCEYRLFTMQFIEHFESHRSGINNLGSLNFKGLVGVSLLHFLKGQYHFHSLQFPFTILFSLLAIVVVKTREQRLTLIGLLSLTYLISFLFILPNWKALHEFLSNYNILSAVSIRFYSLAPLLWFIILGYSTCVVAMQGAIYRKIVAFGLIFMGLFSFLSLNSKDYYDSEYAENSFYRTYFSERTDDHASFSEYYKVDLFSKTQEIVPSGNFYIGCIGFNPEIAQYNGYNTIDGYFFYYPKKKWEVMNSISRMEHEKSKINGADSRCYLWSDDVAKGKDTITELLLDFDKMKDLNTRYVFADRKILNNRLTNEVMVKEKDENIYIYTIN